ncbi:unnamed protein product [Closterium sp. NIES-64]|nr:unnamed protein product [Closterium sp. NIES-64]
MPGVLTMGGRGPGAVDKLDLAKARVGSGRGVACRNLLSHAQAISEVNGGIEQLGATKFQFYTCVPYTEKKSPYSTFSHISTLALHRLPLYGLLDHTSAPHLLLLDPRLPHRIELGPHNAGTLFIQAQVVGLCSSPSLLVSLLHAVGFRLDGREDERRYPRSVLSVALKPFRLTNRVTPFPSCFPVSLLLPLALPVAPLCAVRRSAQVSPAALVPAFCSSSGPLRLDAASTTGSAGRPVAGPVELQGERRFNSSGSGVVLHWAACVTFILVDLDDPIHPLHKPAVPISGAPPLPSITLPSAPTIPATQHHHSHCTLRHHPSLSPTITYVMTICCHSILPSMPF